MSTLNFLLCEPDEQDVRGKWYCLPVKIDEAMDGRETYFFSPHVAQVAKLNYRPD